jgi:membrane-bound lytic murein transglycosylase B
MRRPFATRGAAAIDRRSFTFGAAVLAASAPFAAQANEQDFPTWLNALRAEARQKGFSQGTIDSALREVEPIARVLELDRRQPETTITFDDYITRVVTQARVDSGRARIAENRELLERVSTRFGVQPRFIVSLWAIETDFGRIQGNFSIIAALATLAYDGRRSAFFREELYNALRMVERGLANPKDMKGSWAGAMGQSQFMPSSFLAYAIDMDGDGKADIWGNRADVFGSIANYLSKVGWKGTETWGREVSVPANFDTTLIDWQKVQKPLAEWHALGVRRADGGDLPARDLTASLVRPSRDSDRPTLLVYNNYRVLLRWNRSLYFASAVGYLADRIGDV